MPSFKSDEEFLTYISMGAAGVRHVIENIKQQGRTPLLLERGSNDFKLWKQLRIKGWRVPDILCVDTGRRVESRAKTSFEISGSHSTNNPERAWDFGLYDTDYIAIPVCRKSGDRPIDWQAIDLVQYVSIGDMRKARQAGLTVQPDAKSAQQGSEIRLIWPSSIATASGKVTEVRGDRVKYKTDANRTNWVRLSKGGKAMKPLVKVGDPVQPFQVLASVVSVFQIISDEPRVNYKHYLKDLESPSPNVRFSAAKALGLFDNPTVRKALLEQLEKTDLHIFVRLEAAASLARFGVIEGWNLLTTALTSEFLSNRLESVIVLAEIDSPQARQMLLAVLADRTQDAEVRAGAAWALGEHHDKSALKALVQVFADSSLSVRIEAARALSKLAPAAWADIVSEFGQTDDQRRPGIAWAVSKSGAVAVADLLPHLQNYDARQWAAYVIGTQDPQAYVGQIEQLKQGDPELYFAVTVLWKILTSWVFKLKEYG